jgi:phage host-nuclease inhibitor protein Gam
MARTRSAAQRAPQTKEHALVLADRYAAQAREAEKIIADRDAELQKINAAADALLVPIDAELKDIAKQLKPWFAANFEALTDGKRKSIELGGCHIGYRINPPKVEFAHGNDEAAAATLLAATLADFVRVKHSPDKPALLTQLDFVLPAEAGADDVAKAALTARLGSLGFSVKQTEVFFVDRMREDAGA